MICAVLLLEALALLAAAAWFTNGLITSTPQSFGGALFLLVLLLVFAGWLLTVGHFLYRGYRWTRSAALVFQLFMVILAIPILTAGVIVAGLLMLVPAAVVILQLFSRPVLAYTSRTTDTSRTF